MLSQITCLCVFVSFADLTDLVTRKNFAKTLVNADRASLFMVDALSKELYARIFDTGAEGETHVKQEIRYHVTWGGVTC